MERLRISYAKSEGLRYTSNLDVHKVWERLLRRARLPLAYSQGFHPQPRINQAAPLPLGFLSQVEMVDIWLEEDIPLDVVKSSLVKTAPPGLEIKNVTLVDPREPALPTVVRSSCYRVTILDPFEPGDIIARLDTLLKSTEVVRDRRGKTYDLRPLIEELSVESGTDGLVIINMQLTVRDSATGRPDEVLLALGLDPFSARIERTELILHPLAN
jgi:radical SAM-linked protein